MPVRVVGEATLTAEDQFVGPLRVRTGTRVNITLRGVSASTITLQRQTPDVGVWLDVEQWTANTAATYLSDERQDIRLGIKTGDKGADSPLVRLGRG